MAGFVVTLSLQMDLSSFLLRRLHLLTPACTFLSSVVLLKLFSLPLFLLSVLSFCLPACKTQVATRLCLVDLLHLGRKGGPEGSFLETVHMQSLRSFELPALVNHCLQ